MPRLKSAAAKADSLTKHQRYRQSQARKGMKLLRIWVPDPARAFLGPINHFEIPESGGF